MTFISLKEAPADASSYLETTYGDTDEKTKQNLRFLIKQGFSNLKVLMFDLETLKNLEPEILENGYSVQIVAKGTGSDADFYLKKF
jgi:hypothetical protein